jgi:hypothetical protein
MADWYLLALSVSDVEVAAITAVAATIAGVIAAVATLRATNRRIVDERERQDRELGARTEGQKRELEAAEKRQRQELEAAERRERQELDDAERRQRQELEAAEKRQAEALAHDREVSDLADLRKLLDEAAVAIDAARAARESAQILGGLVGIKPTPGSRRRFSEDATQKLGAARPLLVALNARLRIRLGSDDPITESLEKAATALAILGIQSKLLETDEFVDMHQPEEAVRAGNEFDESAEAFFAAAVDYAGTVGLEPGRIQRLGSGK